ncbi:hypothetical protein MRX96_045159 [Rhipicephalus microplus]
MISRVVVRSGDDDKPQGSRASSDLTQAAGRKDTGAPKEFHEKKHAEVQPRIAEEGMEAESIGERQRERGVGSSGVSFELGMEFSDAGYEPRPAAACASGTFPVSNQSADAEKRDHGRVREIFSENGGRSVSNPTRLRCGIQTFMKKSD